MNAEAKAPKRRRWWRWIVYFMLFALVMIAALGWWAWRERVMLVNALLQRAGGDTRVQITTLEWENGMLHLRGLNAMHLPSAQRVAEVGHIEWRMTLPQLWGRNLGSVKVEGGAVDAALALFATQGGGTSSSPSISQPWRLESLDLASTKIVLRDAKGEPLLSVTVQGGMRGGTTAVSFESTSLEAADLMWQGKSVSSRFKLDAVMKNDRFEINKISLHDGHFDLAWMQGFRSLLRGSVDLEWEGRDMVISRTGLVAGGSHEVRLKNLLLQPPVDSGLVKATAVDLKVSQDSNGNWDIESGAILKPEVEWTRELEELLLPKGESKPPQPWKVRLSAFEVKDAKVKLSPTELNPLAGGFDWSAKLQGLKISPEGVQSSLKQRLEMKDVSLQWGRIESNVKPPPFLLVKSAAAEVAPDKLRELWLVDSLKLTEPHIELKPENGPWFDKVTAESPPPVEAAQTPPFWQRLQFGDLTVNGASFAMAMQLAERIEVSAWFDIATQQGKQRLHIADARVQIPKRANLPVFNLENVEAVAVLPEMWERRRLESLKFSGGQMEVGDALMTLFNGKAAAVEEKVEKTTSRWTAGKINVGDVGVTILNIAPGLPPVRFEVNFAAKETPLDLDGLAENVEPQQIVLSRLRIPSPYEPLRTVAEMDVIHVNYTLDGLLHRRIDRVEIVSPLLYVGEDLFWYVENYRKYMKGEAQAPDASVGPPAPPKPTAPGWHVDTLAVSDGRLLLAPKGVPLPGFSKPFPFSFTSKLESGQLDAVFDIPSDNYTLKDLKLEFLGMKGKVHFNLPMKDKNNNLTETFTMDQLRWKDMHVEKAHLSVTYDAHGIYGTFGGEAYGGYVNGAFDIYLDEVYTWDGWVSGADVRLGPVTRALFPNYFLLEGSATLKTIATGNMNELYQGDVEFKNRSKGRFSIEALNDAIKELPPALKGDVASQIRRIGLETLRDFEYDSVDGKARFYGREGRGHLRFTGPQGMRNIDVNVYDHRWKEEPRKSDTANSHDE